MCLLWHAPMHTDPRQDRRYFKQQEITLWRKGPTKDKKTFIESDATKKL